MAQTTARQLVRSTYRIPGRTPTPLSIKALLFTHGFDPVSLTVKAKQEWWARCTQIQFHLYARSRDRIRAYRHADLAYFGQCRRGDQ